jgi:beta-glucanase (GH16 family)
MQIKMFTIFFLFDNIYEGVMNKRRFLNRLKGISLVTLLFCFAIMSFTACAEKEQEQPGEQPTYDYVTYFSDEFDGDELDGSKWMCQTGMGESPTDYGWGNNEQQYYLKDNVKVSGGTMKIHAKKETYGSKSWTSARVITRDNFYRTYGRFEARIKLPADAGFWPAFWMKPQNSPYGVWAARGEIDIMEARGRLPTEITSALHYGNPYPDNKSQNHKQTFPNGGRIDDFHVYAVEWSEHEIRWYIDDKLHFAMTSNSWWTSGDLASDTAPFDVDFYMLLNLAVGGNYDGGTVPTVEHGVMEVDYVKVRSLEKVWHMSRKTFTPSRPPAPSGKTLNEIEDLFKAAGYTVTRSSRLGLGILVDTIIAQKGSDKIEIGQFLTKETAGFAKINFDSYAYASGLGPTCEQDNEILYFGTSSAIAVYESFC